MNIFKRIKNKTVKIIKWAPVIWKDEDWDHHYFYIILHRKLKNMEDFFNSDRAMTLHSGKEAKKMKFCIDLLDRIINDEYDISAFKKHNEKWGKPKFNWIKKDNEYSKLEIKHKNVKTEKDKIQEKKDFHRAYEHEAQMRKQDIKYLFNYLEKYIESWWD